MEGDHFEMAALCIEMKLMLLRLAELLPRIRETAPASVSAYLTEAHTRLNQQTVELRNELRGSSGRTIELSRCAGGAHDMSTARAAITENRAQIVAMLCHVMRTLQLDSENEKQVLRDRLETYMQQTSRSDSALVGSRAISMMLNDLDRAYRSLEVLEEEQDHASESPTLNRTMLQHEIDQLIPSFEVDPERPPQSETCTICMSEFANGLRVRAFKPCKHWFHESCIDAWLMSWAYGPSCPLCRVPLEGASMLDQNAAGPAEQ